MNRMHIEKNSRILVLGAGPAGLGMAYFLTQKGFKNIVVFEKRGQVGGMCKTVTADGQSIDLGATYISASYKLTKRLARRLKVKTVAEDSVMAVNLDNGRAKYSSVLKTAMGNTGIWRYARACVKYVWLRRKYRKIVDQIGFTDIHKHPELCVPFRDWLIEHDIVCLEALFRGPITIMGYGRLDTIPAPYVLKYINFWNFLAMVLRWPPLVRRFELGFQRLWERISWELDVKLNVDILAIRRGNTIEVEFKHRERLLDEDIEISEAKTFDAVVIACPHQVEDLEAYLDLRQEERELFSVIENLAYCLVTYSTRGVKLPARTLAVLHADQQHGRPLGIAQQSEHSDFLQFYSMADPSSGIDRDAVLAEARACIEALGGSVDEQRIHTFHMWPYFEHVSHEAMRDGFYARLDKIQGQRNTFFVGGLANFETVETILQHCKNLVDVHFRNRD